jgi:hypothetical protein
MSLGSWNPLLQKVLAFVVSFSEVCFWKTLRMICFKSSYRVTAVK